MRTRLALCLSLALLPGTLASARDVVLIEEEWELRLGEPDSDSSSPQVSMLMSATGDLESDYFVFAVNHHSAPQWSAGGLQVQYWNDGVAVETDEPDHLDTLHHYDEIVSWTQRLRLDNGELVFEVRDGNSESWGEFGGCDLRVRVPADVTRLNAYRPAVSIEESGVSYAGNRVRSLTLQKLRWRFDDGEESELTAPIDIDADIDP
jgi:hypothetical protein